MTVEPLRVWELALQTKDFGEPQDFSDYRLPTTDYALSVNLKSEILKLKT